MFLFQSVFLQKIVDGLKCIKCEWAGKQKIEISAPNIFQREIVCRCAKCNYEVSLINSQSINDLAVLALSCVGLGNRPSERMFHCLNMQYPIRPNIVVDHRNKMGFSIFQLAEANYVKWMQILAKQFWQNKSLI